MSKFDFAKLREQVQKTNEELKEKFKGTDNQIYGNLNRPEGWRENVSEANRKKHADPVIKQRLAEANRKSALDPIARKNRLESNQKKRNDPVWQQNHKAGCEKRWEDPEQRLKHKERMNDPEILAAITEKNRKLAQDPLWREKTAKNNKEKRNNPRHIKKHQEAVADRSINNDDWIRKNCRPVSTPYGIFQKLKDLVEFYRKDNSGNQQAVTVRFRKWLNSDQHPDWSYLTWDEYDRLKK
jgi:hypothetical protein